MNSKQPVNMRRVLPWALIIILFAVVAGYRWLSLHMDDPKSDDLWGRMNKASQEKIAVEINRASSDYIPLVGAQFFIYSHPLPPLSLRQNVMARKMTKG